MNHDILRQLSMIITFALTLIVNAMASNGTLGGMTQAEISNQFDIYFVPANTTFAVWGVIYTGLTAYVVYHSLPGQRQNPYLRRTGWLFILSNLLNIGWLVLFQTGNYLLSVVAMAAILLTLIAIYRRLDIEAGTAVSRGVRWLAQIPFSIYLAWITIATIANVSQALYASGYESLFGIDGAVWAAIMLVVGTGIISAVIYRGRGNVAYALTTVWAIVGIVFQQSETPLVSGTAIAMIVIILAVLGFSLWQNRRPQSSPRLAAEAS